MKNAKFIRRIIVEALSDIDSKSNIYTGKTFLRPIEDAFYSELSKRDQKQRRLFNNYISTNKNNWLQQLRYSYNLHRDKSPEYIAKRLLQVLDDKYKAGQI